MAEKATLMGNNPENLLILKILVQTSAKNITHPIFRIRIVFKCGIIIDRRSFAERKEDDTWEIKQVNPQQETKIKI